MKNIHVLPTDKPSRLLVRNDKPFVLMLKEHSPFATNKTHTNQNIDITSDEEIKEGDWFYNIISLKPEPFKACENGDGYVNCSKYSHYRIDCKKIILTDNKDLIKDGVQSIDDEFLEWFVKNPSCERVEVERGKLQIDDDGQEYGFPDMSKYKIIIPQEEPKQEGYICPQTKLQCRDECCVSAEDCHIEAGFGIISDCEPPKQETIEEASKKHLNSGVIPNDYQSFIKGPKWQAERMYSEEDMFEFSQWISHEDWVYLPSKGYWVNEEQEELKQKLSSKEILNLWFEQFKKK